MCPMTTLLHVPVTNEICFNEKIEKGCIISGARLTLCYIILVQLFKMINLREYEETKHIEEVKSDS